MTGAKTTSGLPTRIEKEAGRPLTPLQIFDITATRETTLSRLLMLYISTGLIFMLLPGTFLGVWNLLAISSHRAANSVSPAWIQAHGHAQIFAWIGTFILGIGFYSIPKLRRLNSFALSAVWSSWALWTVGVTVRWLTSVYQWEWRILLPVSGVLELAAFAIFFRTVSGHRTQHSGPEDSGKTKLEEWVFVVIAGSVGLLVTLLVNVGVTLFLALRGTSAAVPADFDQRFLVLQTWINWRIKNKNLSKPANGGEGLPQLNHSSFGLGCLARLRKECKGFLKGTCASRKRNQGHFQLSPTQRTGWHRLLA